MYQFMTIPVHVHTVIPINHLDLPINVATALHVHRCTCSSVYLFSVFLHFRQNMHIYLSTNLLEINLPVYLHTSLLSSNKYLPVTTNTCVPAHRCTLSWPYLFIFILYFRLNAKIHPSTFQLRCMTLFIFMFLFRLTTKTYLLTHVLVRVPTHIYINTRSRATCSFSYLKSH